MWPKDKHRLASSGDTPDRGLIIQQSLHLWIVDSPTTYAEIVILSLRYHKKRGICVECLLVIPLSVHEIREEQLEEGSE